jgi:hypothetical protein
MLFMPIRQSTARTLHVRHSRTARIQRQESLILAVYSERRNRRCAHSRECVITRNMLHGAARGSMKNVCVIIKPGHANVCRRKATAMCAIT